VMGILPRLIMSRPVLLERYLAVATEIAIWKFSHLESYCRFL